MAGKEPRALLADIDEPGGRLSVHRRSLPPNDPGSPVCHQPACYATALDEYAHRSHRKTFCTHSYLILCECGPCRKVPARSWSPPDCKSRPVPTIEPRQLPDVAPLLANLRSVPALESEVGFQLIQGKSARPFGSP